MESTLNNTSPQTPGTISEDASPNPEFLIKSIAEQGYSLETALADLMDNSISANATQIEVLVDFESEPFRLFIADNGDGMTEDDLIKNMQFPSSSPETSRQNKDLGRFGLGLKTASFSQTRKFTVLSRKKGEIGYNGRTWDIAFLKENGWKIIVNSEDEIQELVLKYQKLSGGLFNGFDGYAPNTIILWDGLYKFEQYLNEENRKNALKREINEVTSEHLSMVFHRFMEKKENQLQIRINNNRIIPFNPFPKEIRGLEPMQTKFKEDVIKVEGYVLPSKSMEESKKGLSKWSTRYRSLLDMEGLYIYREDRIILFGGWNGLIKKQGRMQLARMKVEVGNNVDNVLHLNVSKSQIAVPFELRRAFMKYIEELKIQAEREFYNREASKSLGGNKTTQEKLFGKSYSNKGSVLTVNNNFPLIKSLTEGFTQEQASKFNTVLRMINTKINHIRRVHEDQEFIGIEEQDGVAQKDILTTVTELKDSGVSSEFIKKEILPHLGFTFSSLPEEVKELVNK